MHCKSELADLLLAVDFFGHWTPKMCYTHDRVTSVKGRVGLIREVLGGLINENEEK